MYIFQPDRHLLRIQIRKFAHYLPGSILDIGAGKFDRYSDFFPDSKYIRMDINAGPGIDLVGSVENMPCPNDIFDGVVCTQVLEHVAHPVDAIREIARVLKPGGYCLVTIPQFSELHEEPYDFFRYTSYGLKNLFQDAGMKCLELNPRGGYWTLIFYIRVRYFIDRFNLYSRSYLGYLASKIFKLAYILFKWLDEHDHSDAARRHTIGWAGVFQKAIIP